MKALSLTQPRATLVAIGAKRIETRSWKTSYRGPLLIHAAKGFPNWAKEMVYREPFRSALIMALPSWLPLGALIAQVNLVDCIYIDPWNIPGAIIAHVTGAFILPPEPELSFGDYSPGRYALILEDAKLLPEPIPYRGQQRLFEVPEGIATKGGQAP